MIYLVAIFVPPLYFLLRKKWGGFAVSMVLLVLALLALPSIVFTFLTPVFWFIAAVHAVWALRGEVAAENAELIATKLAEKIKQP